MSTSTFPPTDASPDQWAMHSSATRNERVPVFIFDDASQLAIQVARKVANLIESKAAIGEYAVLGLPTGSTPIGVYQELVRMHKEEDLDFLNVITFNLDEYFPMAPDSLQSYHRFMHENFFDHVNVPKENIHIPRGDIPMEDVDMHCAKYEHQIEKVGGIDLLLLGIGRSGHIGFNEPGSRANDRTRLIVLDEITRKDAASDFFEEVYVPRQAITMGVGTILEAKEIVLMATGEHKARIMRSAVEEEPNNRVSATFLQRHKNTTFYVDKAAGSELTRQKTPWLVRRMHWTDAAISRALIWLARTQKKAIQQLDTSDFHRNHLHDLVYQSGHVDELTQRVYMDLRSRIKYDSDLPRKKRVIVFSPHPDDDVISMGGMLGKLVKNENEIIVAYMTNGSVAVFDEDVQRHISFMERAFQVMLPEGPLEDLKQKVDSINEFLEQKAPASVDRQDVQQLKAQIRYTEAIAAIEVMGLDEKNARFLDLPFYKTGRVKKDPISQADVDIILDLFAEMRPDHIYVAGDLSDPHGTHRMCYKAIKEALHQYRNPEEKASSKTAKKAKSDEAAASGDGATSPAKTKAKGGSRKVRPDEPLVWLYRGAWQEWEIDQADVLIPLTKSELDRKIDSIYKHESQKDRALFPGAYDEREFWQRARDRNVATAEALDALGLPEFFAAEAYVTVAEMP